MQEESGGDQTEVRSERRCRRRGGEWRRPGRGEIRKEMQEERRRPDRGEIRKEMQEESGGEQTEVRSERRCKRRGGEWRRTDRGEIRKEMQEERRRVEETRQR